MNLRFNRYLSNRSPLLMLGGFLALLAAFVATFPEGPRNYLAAFVQSWAVVLAGVLVISAAGRFLRRAPAIAIVPATAAAYFLLIVAFDVAANAIEWDAVYPGSRWLGDVVVLCLLGAQWREAWQLGACFAAIIAILASADMLTHLRKPAGLRDFAYYPRWRGLARSLRTMRGRVVLILGFSFVFFENAQTAFTSWRLYPRGGPGEVFLNCVYGWGLLWIVDSLARPRRAMRWIAVGFFFWNIMFVPVLQELIVFGRP
jgi:hypothetical protein